MCSSVFGNYETTESRKICSFCPCVRLYRTQLLLLVPPECWIFKMASLCYFLVSSYRSALSARSKCNLGSISSFLICPPAAEHTLQRNMKENSRRQTRMDRPVCKKKLGNYNKCEFSNFFLFQWPKISSVLVTWMIVDCNLAVRVVLSFYLCAIDQFKNARFFARLQTLSLGQEKKKI